MPDRLQDLAVYIHWPYCARICPYCDFNVARDRGDGEEAAALAHAIVRDLEHQAERIGAHRLVSIFFGGGTPSLMAPEHAAEMIATARRLFTPAPDLEITLEANPTDAEAARFEAFAAAGVSRLSLGVQSLDDGQLKFLGRNHDAEEARRAATIAGETFSRLSLDLIYALPGQTPDTWRRDLEAALALNPEHVSPYQLTIESGTAFDRSVKRGAFVPTGEDVGADLFDVTQTTLNCAGFTAYEVSNHARGNAARSQHNLAIWRGADYLGAGPGAHGRLTLRGSRTATRGTPKIADYVAAVEDHGVGLDTVEPLNRREAAEERLLLGLRIEEGVPLSVLKPLGDVSAKMVALSEMGLVEVGNDRLRATSQGRLVLDRVIRELLT